MPDEIDWSLTTFEGNRRRQHEKFHALSFREKLIRIEQMGEVADRLALNPSLSSHGQRTAAGEGLAGEAATPATPRKTNV